MMRFLFFLVVPFLLIACSKDKPTPVAPAGKAQATLAAPPAPTNLRFEAVTDSSCRVLWDAVEGATDYDVNYKPAVGGRWTNQPHRGVRLHNTIHDLAPNTEYRWAVRAENGDGASAWIHGPSFTTYPSQEDDSSDVSPAPTNLRFDTPTDSSCTVRWDAVEGATDYDVNYKPASGGRWTNEPHRGASLHNTIHDLQPNTEYRWAVRAESSDGASAWIHGPNFTTLDAVEEESAEPIGDFNIELVFFDGPKYPFTAEEKRLIRNAADFWERVIGGDVPDYTLTEEDRELLAGIGPAGTGYASIGYSNAFDTPAHIDDLRIYVSRDDGDYNYIPPCNGLNLRAFGLSSIGKIEVNYLLNEYGYFGASTVRRSPDIYWSEDRFLWQTAHEIGHAILGHPEEEKPSLYYWEKVETRVKRERPRLIGIYYVGANARQAYEETTEISNLKGIDIKLWFKGMGPPGFHGWSLQEMIWRWPPARFHWPFHQALENSLMAYRTPQDMPLDAPLEISQVTRGALIDLGYQVEGMSIP